LSMFRIRASVLSRQAEKPTRTGNAGDNPQRNILSARNRRMAPPRLPRQRLAEYMLPALADVDSTTIVAAQELRYISPDGALDAFSAPERTPQPEWPVWVEHAYVLMGTHWRHAASHTPRLEASKRSSEARSVLTR